MKKRLIAFLLVLIMVLGMLPVSAFAADGDATKYTVTYYKNDGSENDLFYKTDDWGRPSEKFNIYWEKPTRDGYDFVGWAETRDATEAKYASGGAGGKQSWIKLDGPKVLYAVWQEAGLEPEAPRSPSDCEDQLKTNKIKLVCVDGNHPDKMITFADVSYFSNWSMGDTCRLNFYAKDAALKYPGHAPKNPEERIYVTFKWVNDEKDANGKYLPGKWVMDETTAAVVELVDTGVEAPSQPTTAQLGNIKVTCRTDAAHSSEFPVASCMGTIVGTVTFDSVKKQWYIDTAPMTTQLASRYDSWKGYAEGTHRLVNPDAKLNARFYYDGGKWYTEDTLAIDICCGAVSEIPGDQKPNIEEANAKIRVQCTAYPSKHNPYKQNYRILPGSYDDLGWDRTEYGYIYSIRLNRAKYIAQFDQEIGRPHTDTEPNKETRINWRWENGAWHLIDGPDGVTADIKCICAEIKEPTREDIFKALNGLVTVTCINRFWKDGNKNMDCGQGQYAAKAGIVGQDYTLEEGENAGTWVVTFPVTNFVKSFKQDPAHNLYTKDTLSWYIRWKDNAWTSAPVEPGVDDLVKLTHAPTDWREVAKIATGGKSDCIHTHCVNSGLNVCDYGITVPFVNFKEDVVSVVPEEGRPGSYIATFRVDKFVDARAKVCNDKNFKDAPRTHKLLTQETVRWRLYATDKADEKIGSNVPNHVWEAEPVKAGKDDVCTIAHNWVVTFNPDNGEPAFTQNVEYEGKAIKPTPDPEKTGYTFDGWYLGEAEEPFSFDTTITSDITLTAKWHVTLHNIYAYARLNSYFAPLTADEFDTPVTLNAATLSRLGLGSYNSLGYISIGSFDFDAMPLTDDLYFDDDPELAAAVAELTQSIALETGVSEDTAKKIAWTVLYKTVNKEDMAPGYPADDGYQLSGNLNLATVMFKAGGDNVKGMPAVNYTYDDILEIHDFYFAGDTFTLPADPTREGYSFEGWSVKVLPDENDADHLDADGEDDAADETLLKAGDTYTITAGGVIFTAQWKLNTYIIASDLRINGDTANLADGKTYAWTHRYGGNYGETIDYQPMFDALKARALAVDAANEPYDAEIKLCFPGNKNKLFNETILTYGQEGGGWNPGVKNTAYIWGYATTSYEVIFNSDGGSAVDTQIVKYGEKAVKPEDPTMKGYNFLGWFDKDGNPFDFDTEITHKTELKAQWEKKDYIIASDLRINGDTANLADGKDYPWTHRYGGKYEETIDYQPMFDALKARALEVDKANEPNPTKVDVELRFPGSKDRLFNEEILTYGQDGGGWNPGVKNTAYIWGYAWTYYDVTFVTPEGATTVDAQLIKNGDCAAKPADPTKEGWKFLGWYADAAFKTEFNFDAPITKKTSVYAKFELTSTPIGDIYVRYDVLHIKQLPDGTYDLANAEVEHLNAKKDTTVTAVIKDYRATHHVNVNRTLSKLTDTAIRPYPGPDGKPVYTILTVYYDLDFHTLTFDTMGGSKIAPETVRHGLTVAKPKDPVNGGYIFDGWYTDKTFRHRYDFSTPLTEDITIYAKWFLIVLPGVTVKKNTPKLNTADHFAYVQGYPDGTVKPAGNITRAETAAILFRLMDEGSRKTYYSTKSGFRDVASGSWYNTYVATLNNAGVITDSSNGCFRPNEAITRAELAAMLANFTETTGAANYFNDVSAKYWAANAIAICAKLGWITGYPDGTFRPDKNVTRAELMAMINRATGRAPKSADAFLPGMKTWSDNTSDKWYYLDVQEATNSHSYTVKGSETWTALTSDPNWSLYE